jgi:hypothetical protein
MNLEETFVDRVRSRLSERSHDSVPTSPVLLRRGHDGRAKDNQTWHHLITLPLGIFLVLSMALTVHADAQKAERQDFGGGGLFSYVLPNGWKVAEFPGLKFKISRGEPVKDFAPNIIVIDETYTKSLDDYAKDNIAAMKKMFQGMKLLGQSDFKTADGTRAIKLLTERYDEGAKKNLRQIYYLYDAGNTKLVVTCSNIAEEGPGSDPVFDAAMKTFVIKPGKH